MRERLAAAWLAIGAAACGSSSGGSASNDAEAGVAVGAGADAGANAGAGADAGAGAGADAGAGAGADAGAGAGADAGPGAGAGADAGPGAGADASADADADAHVDAGADAASGTTVSVYATFYGWADNDPPGTAIAYPKNGGYPTVHNAAGGTGTFADPITFATDKAEFAPGTVLYVPFIEKYVVMEDDCAECDTDWSTSQKHHIDIWMNSSAAEMENALIQCEDSWTRTTTNVEVNPPATRTVTTAPLFDPATNICRAAP